MTLAINIHRDATAAIGRLLQARPRQHKAAAEWYRITAELEPSKGVQFVKPSAKFIATLLDAGLIKRHAGRAHRYYVPRTVAFVSVEPSMQHRTPPIPSVEFDSTLV